MASMTAPDGINNRRYRNYDDPVSMFDRGATMSVKDPLTLQNYLNITSPSNISEVVNKMFNIIAMKCLLLTESIIRLKTRLCIKLMNT